VVPLEAVPDSERDWHPGSNGFVLNHGGVTLVSSYINNIHPARHKELYLVIPEILQHALPMFERVLSDLLRPLLPMRIATSRGHEFDCILTSGVWHADLRERKFTYPDARKQYGGDLDVMNNRISLKGRTLQVIVRLANIVLTPERPEYPGGKWHIEGLLRSHPIWKDWH